MNQKILKNQKPTDYDIHLKYLCSECGGAHWLSYLEASTKNFKIVCCCGNVFGVRRVTGFNLDYFSKPKTTEAAAQISEEVKKEEPKDIPLQLLNKASKVLVGYGFTMAESISMIKSCYSSNPTEDISVLIKQTLVSLKG
jgi:hypothetical protein